MDTNLDYYEGRGVQFLMEYAFSTREPSRDIVYNKLVFKWIQLKRELGGTVTAPHDPRFNDVQFYFDIGQYRSGLSTYTFNMMQDSEGEWILYDTYGGVIATLEEWARYTFRENVAYFYNHHATSVDTWEDLSEFPIL
jgi:hypothetical protein